jgi:hypothetical protein
MSRWNAFCALCLYDGKGIDASATGAVDGARFWTGHRIGADGGYCAGAGGGGLCDGVVVRGADAVQGCALRGLALGVVVVLLGVLRYQVYTALSPLPYMLGIGVLGQRGVFSGLIVEEPERGDGRVRFVVALEKMETDSAIYHLAGQALVTVKVPGFRAGYGDRIRRAIRGRSTTGLSWRSKISTARSISASRSRWWR